MGASQLFRDCVFAHTGTVARAPPRRRQHSARRASGRPRRQEDVDDGVDVEGRAGLVLGSCEGCRGRGRGNGNHGGSSAVKMTNGELCGFPLRPTST